MNKKILCQFCYVMIDTYKNAINKTSPHEVFIFLKKIAKHVPKLSIFYTVLILFIENSYLHLQSFILIIYFLMQLSLEAYDYLI